jgi:ribosome biogenesis GTPase
MTTSQVRLDDLGWDDSWREALGLPAAAEGDASWSQVQPGRISRVDRGLCVVLTEAGPLRASAGSHVLDAMARDSLAGPCTGDWCLLREWADGPVTIDRLAPRRTLLQRAEAARGSRGQALAANVDVAAVVVALHPEPNLGRIERLLTIAWESGARPMVLLTKSDLVVDAAAIAEDTRAVAPGVEVIVCSATTGEGIDRVRGFVARGSTLALLGASGHGKSSLANRLVGAPLLTTRTIRDDGKGRHTSVRRELVLLPGAGAVIDTPGLRGVGLQ